MSFSFFMFKINSHHFTQSHDISANTIVYSYTCKQKVFTYESLPKIIIPYYLIRIILSPKTIRNKKGKRTKVLLSYYLFHIISHNYATFLSNVSAILKT